MPSQPPTHRERMRTTARPDLRTLLGKVAASVATVALAGGLMAFAHYAGFHDAHDPFPHSVVAGR